MEQNLVILAEIETQVHFPQVSAWLTGFSGSNLSFQQFLQVVASAEASLSSTTEEVNLK